MEQRSIAMMADIMGGIEQTDEWTELQMNDPGIQDAESRFHQALEEAEAYLPREVYVKLSDTQGGVASAYSSVAILYGMRVAAGIQAVVANPAEITRFWLDKKEEAGV